MPHADHTESISSVYYQFLAKGGALAIIVAVAFAINVIRRENPDRLNQRSTGWLARQFSCFFNTMHVNKRAINHISRLSDQFDRVSALTIDASFNSKEWLLLHAQAEDTKQKLSALLKTPQSIGDSPNLIQDSMKLLQEMALDRLNHILNVYVSQQLNLNDQFDRAVRLQNKADQKQVPDGQQLPDDDSHRDAFKKAYLVMCDDISSLCIDERETKPSEPSAHHGFNEKLDVIIVSATDFRAALVAFLNESDGDLRQVTQNAHSLSA